MRYGTLHLTTDERQKVPTADLLRLQNHAATIDERIAARRELARRFPHLQP